MMAHIPEDISVSRMISPLPQQNAPPPGRQVNPNAPMVRGDSTMFITEEDSIYVYSVSSLSHTPSTRTALSKAFMFDDDEVEESAVLPKGEVLELVKWLLRKSSDTKRTEEVLKIFSTTLEGGLNYEEFVLMYEGKRCAH
jgi:Ca2+-binding EF-hand superfamily protein